MSVNVRTKAKARPLASPTARATTPRQTSDTAASSRSPTRPAAEDNAAAKRDREAARATNHRRSKTLATSSPLLARGAVLPSDLVKLGYDKRIATQLAADAPQLAGEIVRWKSQATRVPANDAEGKPLYFAGQPAWEPVTLYRGIDQQTFEVVFEGESGRRTYVALEKKDAIDYAVGHPGRREHGLLVEVQVPRALLVGDPEQGDFPALRQERVPDLRPFIVRLGVVPYTQAVRKAYERADDSVGRVARVEWKPGIEPFVE